MHRVVSVALSVLLVACGGPVEPAPISLDGIEWRAVSINGVAIPPAGAPTLEIEGDVVRGRSGCNSYGAQVRIEGGRLRTTGMGGTAALCPDPAAMAMETTFLEVLGSGPEVVTEPGGLGLRGPAGEIVFVADAP